MFKELKIWQKSMDLVVDIYATSESFPKIEEYNLKSQIRRAIVSVPLNIAEGKSRYSSKEFSHFLNIANASLTEVEVILLIASKLGYISNTNDNIEKIHELGKMISSFSKKLKKD